jgi:hypothetical protein
MQIETKTFSDFGATLQDGSKPDRTNHFKDISLQKMCSDVIKSSS